MLTSKLPYPQENPTELMWAIVSKETEPLPESIPPHLRKVVQKALAKLPENRFQTAREMHEELQRALLNISHPTFAPTEVLEKKKIDNETIEDKSIVTEIPKLPVVVEKPQQSVVTHFVDKTVNQNQPQANIVTEYNLLPTTVASVEPQYQESVPPTVLQITEVTNNWTTARIVRLVFYILAPIIGFLTIMLSYAISYTITETLFYRGDSEIFFSGRSLINIPFLFIFFGIVGGLFGYFIPQEKWRWGLWLNVINFFVGIAVVTTISSHEPIFLRFSIILEFLTLLVVPFLSSSLGSWLTLRKTEKKIL